MGLSDQEKMKEQLAALASAVITAIRRGDAGGRAQLVDALKDMDTQMPGISEDTAQAKEFLNALIGLLEGNPVARASPGTPELFHPERLALERVRG